MNTTLRTETAPVAKATTPQRPSGDSATQKQSVDPAIAKRKKWSRLIIILTVIALAAGAGFYAWQKLHPKNVGFASGNSRIEATEMVLLPLQMLSGGVTPRESMPEFVQQIMIAAPTTPFVKLAQGIIFRGGALDVVWPQFLALALISAVLFAVPLARFRKTIGSM